MVKRLALLLGSLLLLAGLIVGFMPQTVSGVSCGSAFVASNEPAVHDLTSAMIGQAPRYQTAADDCASKLSTVRTVAWPLVGVGAAALYVAYAVGYVERAAARRRGQTRAAQGAKA